MRHRRRLIAVAGLVLGLGAFAASPALSDVGEHSTPVGNESRPVGSESRPGCGFGDQNHIHIGTCPNGHHGDHDNQGNDNSQGDED
jgi:hypothetical protein